jgi:hypothetical protein
MKLQAFPQWARWPLVAGVAYVLFLVVWAPARVLGWVLPTVTDGAVQVVSADGSLWQGSGEVRVAVPQSAHDVSLGSWDWRWNPAAVFRGETSFDVRARRAERWGRVTWRADGMAISDLQAELPASLLTAVPALAGYRPDGMLVIDVAQLSMSAEGRLRGQGRVRWRDVALGAIAPAAMGDSLLEFSGRDGQTMAFTVRPLRGPVEVSARGEWLQSAAVTASGEIALAETGSPWKAWLDSVAQRVDDHRYRFAFDVRTESKPLPRTAAREPALLARHP